MGSFGFLGLVPNLVYDPTQQYVNLCKKVKLSQQVSYPPWSSADWAFVQC